MLKEKSVFIFVLGIIIFSAVMVLSAVPSKHHPRNSEPHTINIVETSGNWEMLWRRPEVYFIGQPITTNDIFCYTTIRQEIQYLFGLDLDCLDIYNGTTKWTSKTGSDEIASDHNQVYVRGGLTRFIAYDADNGQKVWEQSVKARNIKSIVAYNGFVKANVSVSGGLNVYHVFDAVTGTHQDNNTVSSMAYHSFASDRQKVFVTVPSYAIAAYGIQDRVQIWETSLSGRIVFLPIFSDGIVFVRTNYVVGTVHAIDGETGHILWEREDAISNVAVSNSIAFYVTLDGEVMAVDAQTGETQGRLILNAAVNAQTGEMQETLMLTSEESHPFDSGIDHFSYYIEAVDDMVFVYFGDTWQLFAFRFSQE